MLILRKKKLIYFLKTDMYGKFFKTFLFEEQFCQTAMDLEKYYMSRLSADIFWSCRLSISLVILGYTWDSFLGTPCM